MARPITESLDYFPCDVDIFDDEKLLFAADKFGDFSDLIAIKLLSWIYKKGYYCKWSKAHLLLFTRESFRDKNSDKVEEVVAELIEQDFFSKEMYERFQILTSKGIQKRWQFIIKNSKRKAKINSDFALINSEQTTLKKEETSAITDGSTQSKVKKSKVKEKEETLFLPEETIGKIELFFSTYSNISIPDYQTNIKPLENFYLQIPEHLIEANIDECFRLVFEGVKKNGGSIRMDYLITNIKQNITKKLEQILNKSKQNELNQADILRKEAKKDQAAADEEYKRTKLEEYKSFLTDHPDKFQKHEIERINELLKAGKWISAGEIIEPKLKKLEEIGLV